VQEPEQFPRLLAVAGSLTFPLAKEVAMVEPASFLPARPPSETLVPVLLTLALE